jgi:DNA helicase II / ATP-dependent DNA helicase PcrA
MSNSLIGHDPAARPSPLKPQAWRSPANVHIVQHTTSADEADAIAAFIDNYLTDKPNLPPGQVLVLSPRRIFGNAIRDALLRRRRNAMSFFWEDALDNDSAAAGYCLLTLLVTPEDRTAYRAWLGIGLPDGNTAGYRRIRDYAQANNLEPRAVCELLAAGAIQLPHTSRVLQRHRDLEAKLATLLGLEGQPLVDALWDADDEDTATIRLAAQTVALTEPTPKDLATRLLEVVTQPELPDSSSDVIRVMSLHKSKGLTADLVVVAGCVAGAIPTVHKDLPPAEADVALKEQRRLFYVAVTRTRDTLILSSVVRLPLAAALRANIPPVGIFKLGGEAFARLAASPLLSELGPDAPQTVRGTDWRTQLSI